MQNKTRRIVYDFKSGDRVSITIPGVDKFKATVRHATYDDEIRVWSDEPVLFNLSSDWPQYLKVKKIYCKKLYCKKLSGEKISNKIDNDRVELKYYVEYLELKAKAKELSNENKRLKMMEEIIYDNVKQIDYDNVKI